MITAKCDLIIKKENAKNVIHIQRALRRTTPHMYGYTIIVQFFFFFVLFSITANTTTYTIHYDKSGLCIRLCSISASETTDELYQKYVDELMQNMRNFSSVNVLVIC